jgi:hypothetical protein
LLAHVLDVTSGKEGSARASYQQRTDLRIIAALLDHAPQRGDQAVRQRVAHLGRLSVISATRSRISHNNSLVPSVDLDPIFCHAALPF